MKTNTFKIKKNVFCLLLFASLFLFNSCSTDIDEISTEKNALEESVIDHAVKGKSSGSRGNAWAIYNGLPANPEMQFHPSDQYINIQRESTGLYKVTFPGLSHLNNGVIHVSGILGDDIAQVRNWGRQGNDLIAYVLTFDGDTGVRTNNQFFNIFLYKRNESNISNAAYNFGNSVSYDYNSKDLRNQITRLQTGKYRVRFPGMQSVDGNNGHFQVTAYGMAPRYYEIESVTQNNSRGVEAIVRIYDINGNLANSDFVASYTDKYLLYDFRPGGYLHYNGNNTPFNLKTDFPFNREVTVEKLGSGDTTYYLVTIPNSYANFANIRPMPMVTSYGSSKEFAYVSYFLQYNGKLWMTINFRSLDGSPLSANPKFNLFYMIGGERQ
ncbi:hypothetical protein U6A24_17010 [Aquimarina gracilis]|uniref:DUF4374 domain-containing protein n=1 Tax=Aquimarina gracilis TaxID=874422 RepID=A0ABU5ZZ88_9FLAO|nr:hypothetical protein [Aquimarina gracilis]MEB3347177.1 hypothetical protein [Aquimarina gracilis]